MSPSSNSQIKLSFISNRTINCSRVPKYDALRKPTATKIDYHILRAISESKAHKAVAKLLLPNITSEINPRTGIQKVRYFQSKTATGESLGIGRFYPKNTVISLPRLLKHTVLKSMGWVDIDMVKGHPSIICAFFNSDECPYVNLYTRNPEKHIDDVFAAMFAQPPDTSKHRPLEKSDIKMLFNLLIYGGSFNTWLRTLETPEYLTNGEVGRNRVVLTEKDADGNPVLDPNGNPVKIVKKLPVYFTEKSKEKENIPYFVKEYQGECAHIARDLYDANKDGLNSIAERVRLDDVDDEPDEENLDPDRPLRNRVVSYFCQIVENHILYIVHKSLLERGVMSANERLLEFDGICFKPKCAFDEKELCASLNAEIVAKTGISVRMTIKPYSNVDEDAIAVAAVARQKDEEEHRVYPAIKELIEERACKIEMGIGKFYRVKNDETGEWFPVDESELKARFREETYTFYNGQNKPQSGIEAWIADPMKRKYIGCETFVRDEDCPEGYLNTGVPYRADGIEKPDAYRYADDIAFFRDEFLMNLCGCAKSRDFLEMFIAHIVQYPASKSPCPVIVGYGGTGKQTFMTFMQRVLGNRYCSLSQDPVSVIAGSWSDAVYGKILIGLDEITKTTFNKNVVEKFKAMITNTEYNYNLKGSGTGFCKSFARYIVFSNNDTPFDPQNDRRRFCFMHSGTKYCDLAREHDAGGQRAFWQRVYALIEDDGFVRAIYDFYRECVDVPPDMFSLCLDDFSNYNAEVRKELRSPYSYFLEEVVMRDEFNNLFDPVIKIESDILFADFNLFVAKNYPNFEKTNIVHFVRKLKKVIPTIDDEYYVWSHRTSSSKGLKINIKNVRSYLKTHFNEDDDGYV